MLGGDEADRVGNIERVARRPDADAGSVGDNFEAERAARRGPPGVFNISMPTALIAAAWPSVNLPAAHASSAAE